MATRQRVSLIDLLSFANVQFHSFSHCFSLNFGLHLVRLLIMAVWVTPADVYLFLFRNQNKYKNPDLQTWIPVFVNLLTVVEIAETADDVPSWLIELSLQCWNRLFHVRKRPSGPADLWTTPPTIMILDEWYLWSMKGGWWWWWWPAAIRTIPMLSAQLCKVTWERQPFFFYSIFFYRLFIFFFFLNSICLILLCPSLSPAAGLW